MSAAQKEINELKEDIAALRSVLEDQLDTSVSQGHSKARAARDELQLVARNAGKSVREFIDTGKNNFSDVRDQTEARIISRPFVSTAVAFAGGIALASLLRRK